MLYFHRKFSSGVTAPRKEKVYSLSREKREEVQAFVEDQLRKGYI